MSFFNNLNNFPDGDSVYITLDKILMISHITCMIVELLTK